MHNFEVVTATTIINIQSKVNDKLTAGWVLCGSMSVVKADKKKDGDPDYYFFQPMAMK